MWRPRQRTPESCLADTLRASSPNPFLFSPRTKWIPLTPSSFHFDPMLFHISSISSLRVKKGKDLIIATFFCASVIPSMSKLENHQYTARIQVQCYIAWETGLLNGSISLCSLKQFVMLSLIWTSDFFSLQYRGELSFFPSFPKVCWSS